MPYRGLGDPLRWQGEESGDAERHSGDGGVPGAVLRVCDLVRLDASRLADSRRRLSGPSRLRWRCEYAALVALSGLPPERRLTHDLALFDLCGGSRRLLRPAILAE